MYETLFAFVISKLALYVNYHLLEKWLHTEKLPFCTEIVGTLIMLLLWDALLICIICSTQVLIRPYYVTAKIYELYLDMCLWSFANFMSYIMTITFYWVTVSCKPPHNDIDPILLLIPFVLFGTMFLFIEVQTFIKILLEYQKAPFIDIDNDDDIKKLII